MQTQVAPRAAPVSADAPPARPASPLNAGPTGLISAANLTKTFGDEAAVRDVTFAVPEGAIFGFIGPSGCGKTTTVRLMTGIYAPTSGRVIVLGQDPQQFSPASRAKLGYMPQQFVLYPNLSVWENMNFSAALYGMGWGRGERLRAMLRFVELDEHRHKLARAISGGMQRRLSLAATLAHDPQVLFLDEPTAGIDPVLRRKLWDYFADLKARGRTLFVTTQYVGEAAYCDLVGVMSDGRLLMVETPEGLRQRAFGGEAVDMEANQAFDHQTVAQVRRLPFVTGTVQLVGETTLRVIVADAGTAIPELIEWARAQNLPLASVEVYTAPLDDVFVELVRRERARE